MATQTIEFAAPSGQTISTVRLFAAGSDTVVDTAAATEYTNAKMVYYAQFTNLPAGRYRLVAINAGGTGLATYWVDTLSATGTYPAFDLLPGQVTDGVWNAALSSYTVNGSFGARIMRTDSASAGNGAKVTGAGHVAADIHELQAGVINNTHFAAGAIDANALAASAVAEIQSGLATVANQVVLIDGVGFISSVLMGSISDAGTAAETYVIAFGGSTYTVDYSGLDATGNRSTTTRTKT